MPILHDKITVYNIDKKLLGSWDYVGINQYYDMYPEIVGTVSKSGRLYLVLVELADHTRFSFTSIPTADQLNNTLLKEYTHSGNYYIIIKTNSGNVLYKLDYDKSLSAEENLYVWYARNEVILSEATGFELLLMGSTLIVVDNIADWKESMDAEKNTVSVSYKDVEPYLNTLKQALVNYALLIRRMQYDYFIKHLFCLTAQWLSYVCTKKQLTTDKLMNGSLSEHELNKLFQLIMSCSSKKPFDQIRVVLQHIYNDESILSKLLDELLPIDDTCGYSEMSTFANYVKSQLN